MSLNRPLAMRASFVVLAVACYFATLGLLAAFPALDQPNTMSSLQWLVGVIGVAVAGDTLRPSGKAMSAFHPAASPPPSGS